jgi:hypothetical protein
MADKWVRFECVDCHPENEDSEYEEPFEMIVPADNEESCPVDYCPRCLTYRGWSRGTEVTVAPVAMRRGGA